jgi:hypothetical protein
MRMACFDERQSMRDRIEEGEEFDWTSVSSPAPKGQHAFAAALDFAARVAWLLAITPLHLCSKRISARLGCHADVVVGTAWTVFLALLLIGGLLGEPPRHGLPFLDRWLLFVVLLSGFGSFFCYVASDGGQRWSISGPLVLSVLIIASLVQFLRWLDRHNHGGLAEIWREASSD